jgi:hypothetical protein
MSSPPHPTPPHPTSPHTQHPHTHLTPVPSFRYKSQYTMPSGEASRSELHALQREAEDAGARRVFAATDFFSFVVPERAPQPYATVRMRVQGRSLGTRSFFATPVRTDTLY